MLERSPQGLLLPALTTAHSHAFQRGMRGKAQRRHASTSDDFWTWRGQMYRAASALDPDTIYAVSKVAFDELARAGVDTVGEFHYVHHAPDGTPYANRTELAERVVDAALAAGLRISLLRTAYFRGGPGRPPEPGQRRFCDTDVDQVLSDVERLRALYKDNPRVRVGLAPHSVRAVPPDLLVPLARYAAQHDLPLHMHVSEQAREVEECVAETGKRPAELLADLGVLSSRFVAVHATQLEPHEARLLGEARAFACVCATTERDLGDGLPNLGAMREAGVRLCTGIDSHVVTDPFDDLRSLETHERLRTRARVTFVPEGRTPAEQLWYEAAWNGALASGFDGPGSRIVIDPSHPTLALVDDDVLLDGIVFGGHPGLVTGFAPSK